VADSLLFLEVRVVAGDAFGESPESVGGVWVGAVEILERR
jgi:hypothetical protein